MMFADYRDTSRAIFDSGWPAKPRPAPASPGLEWPLPVCDLWPIQSESIGVVLACDLLVTQGLSNTGSRDAETGHPVDGVHGQAEAVRLVANGQLQRRVDVALLLVASHVDVALAPAGGK